MDELITSVYSDQVVGGLMPYFTGGQQQWGGGILRSIARFAFPLIKRVIGVATNTAEDMVEGREKSIKKSIVKNAINEFTGKKRKRNINQSEDNIDQQVRRKKQRRQRR